MNIRHHQGRLSKLRALTWLADLLFVVPIIAFIVHESLTGWPSLHQHPHAVGFMAFVTAAGVVFAIKCHVEIARSRRALAELLNSNPLP